MARTEGLRPAIEVARTTDLRFPNESAGYRQARQSLLAKEIELKRSVEAVAAARRALPPGGLVPEDYVFEGLGPGAKVNKVRLSELFAPGKDCLITYSFMFPRHPSDSRPGPTGGATARLKQEESPCPSCTAFLDALDGAAEHVEAAGFNFVVIAKAPLDRLIAFAKDRRWHRLGLMSAAGNHFTCVRMGAAVKCWGQNTQGMLGNGSTATSYSPVSVIGL